MLEHLGYRPASTSKCETEKNIAGSNARYFMAAILSSNAKSIAPNCQTKLTQEDTTLTQQNQSSAASGENSNNTESTKKKKKKRKKEICAAENSVMNAEPDQCVITVESSQTSVREEAFVQPPSKKLKSTKKRGKIKSRICKNITFNTISQE